MNLELAYLIFERGVVLLEPRWVYTDYGLEPTGLTRVWFEPIEDEV